MFSWLTGKVSAYIGGGMLVVMIGLAIALTITRGTLAKARAENKKLTDWQADVRGVTSHAAGLNGLLRLDQVPIQISYLGQAVSDLNAHVAEQNRAIDDMAASSAAKIAAGNEALAQVEKGRAAAEKAAGALRASAASNTGNDGSCTPSAAFLANSGVL
jgi:uncharacterized protein YoxC